jgi:glucose/arabinose dehydrogenase
VQLTLRSIVQSDVWQAPDRQSGGRRRLARRLLALGAPFALVFTLVTSSVLLSSSVVGAATGTIYAQGDLTLPSGVLFLPDATGGHVWESDHGLGFCRLDTPAGGGVASVNQATCNGGAAIRSPGQPTFDPAHNFVYVPDNAAQGLGVWRLTLNPNGTLSGGVLLAPGKLGGNRASATALGSDGHLYVTFGRNRNVLRVQNPHTPAATTASAVVQTIGLVEDRRVGPPAITMVGGTDLYLAEADGVSTIPNVTACQAQTAACTAQLATSISVTAPTFITSNGTDILFISDASSVSRFTLPNATCATGVQDVYATGDGGANAFQNVSGLGLDPSGNLFVGDDTTAGNFILTGRAWRVLAGQPPVVPGTCGAPGTPPPPPPAPALTNGTIYAQGDLTLPSGVLFLPDATGGHVWESDHGLGFCRLDTPAGGGVASVNQATCNGGAAIRSPGQPTFDPAHNFVYVPDNAAQGLGVWRLTLNPNGTLSGGVLLAPGKLGGNRASATALGSDGHLYVTFGRNRNVLRVQNPHTPAATTASAVVQTIGLVEDRRVGPPAITMVGGTDLYLAEADGVSTIPNVTACQAQTAACTAQLATSISVTAPTFITSNGTDILFISDASSVSRFTLPNATCATGVQDVYATGDGGANAFQNVSGLGLDPSGNLFVGDDTTAGNFILTGRVWRVPPPTLTAAAGTALATSRTTAPTGVVGTSSTSTRLATSSNSTRSSVRQAAPAKTQRKP